MFACLAKTFHNAATWLSYDGRKTNEQHRLMTELKTFPGVRSKPQGFTETALLKIMSR